MNTTHLKIELIFVFLFLFIFSHAQIKSIDIKASLLLQDKITDNYSILIYLDGQLKDSTYSKKTNPTIITLDINKVYTIAFKKLNFPEKLVIVHTKVPTGVSDLNNEVFKLEIDLSKNLKDELKDFPVAVLMVSKKEKSLMASEAYYKLTHN